MKLVYTFILSLLKILKSKGKIEYAMLIEERVEINDDDYLQEILVEAGDYIVESASGYWDTLSIQEKYVIGHFLEFCNS